MGTDADGKDAPKRVKSDQHVDVPSTMADIIEKPDLLKSMKLTKPSCYKMSDDAVATLPPEVCEQLIYIAGYVFGIWSYPKPNVFPFPMFPLVAVLMVASVKRGCFKPKKDTDVLRQARTVSKDHPALQQWADAYPMERLYTVFTIIYCQDQYFDDDMFYKDNFGCEVECDVIADSEMQQSDYLLAQALLVALTNVEHNTTYDLEETVETLLRSIRLVKDTH